MKLEIIKSLVNEAEKNADNYFGICAAIALILHKDYHEHLLSLVDNSPVWDGDIISKSRRDDLIDMGLATRICCKGQQGYTGGKYIAYTVLKKLKEMEKYELNK